MITIDTATLRPIRRRGIITRAFDALGAFLNGGLDMIDSFDDIPNGTA